MPSALLVYNPVAGRYPSRLLTERAASLLQKHGWQIQIETSKDGNHITQLAHQAAAEKLDAFYVVGGDGSLGHALPGLIGTQTALGVLPAGTSNVWAQEIGLPGLTWTRIMALEESARQLAQAQVWEVDVGLCNQVPFLLWAGVGLDAFVVHHIEPRSQWEKNFSVVHYLATAVWNATIWHGINLGVIEGGELTQGHFMLAVVSNIHLYAGGIANISPNALLDDGLMDLWLFEGKNLEDAVQQAWNLWAGRHIQSNRVQQIQFQKISLESDSPIHLQIDGEPEKGSELLTIEVLPRALKVLVPDITPRTLFARAPLGEPGDWPKKARINK